MLIQYFGKIMLCMVLITPTYSVAIHSYSNIKERIEDGAYSPKSNNIASKKSESKLTHEVIFGSAKEAKTFDHLSSEESKRRLLLLLSKIDVNDDKFIDPEELYSWIIKSFKKLSDEEAEERFEDADFDKDGTVTWKEQLLDSFGEENDFDIKSEDELFVKADKRLFRAADINGDGFLDKTEYKRFCNPEDFVEMIPILIQNTLEERDLNKDGYIDFEEFISGKDKLKDEAWIISEKEVFVSNYDKNKDGLLNQEEILSWIVPNSSQVAAEETKHLMVAVDDNHDLQLSFEEILSNHDVFVGSEATDFGEHLQNIHLIDEL